MVCFLSKKDCFGYILLLRNVYRRYGYWISTVGNVLTIGRPNQVYRSFVIVSNLYGIGY